MSELNSGTFRFADLYSPLTLLQTRTLFGRPNFGRIFTSLCSGIDSGSYLQGREATLKTRLGVYFCGVSASMSGYLGKALTKNHAAKRSCSYHQDRGTKVPIRYDRRQVCQGALLSGDLVLE